MHPSSEVEETAQMNYNHVHLLPLSQNSIMDRSIAELGGFCWVLFFFDTIDLKPINSMLQNIILKLMHLNWNIKKNAVFTAELDASSAEGWSDDPCRLLALIYGQSVLISVFISVFLTPTTALEEPEWNHSIQSAVRTQDKCNSKSFPELEPKHF